MFEFSLLSLFSVPFTRYCMSPYCAIQRNSWLIFVSISIHHSLTMSNDSTLLFFMLFSVNLLLFINVCVFFFLLDLLLVCCRRNSDRFAYCPNKMCQYVDLFVVDYLNSMSVCSCYFGFSFIYVFHCFHLQKRKFYLHEKCLIWIIYSTNEIDI